MKIIIGSFLTKNVILIKMIIKRVNTMVITFKNVSFQYTDMPLLNDVSLSITEHDKIGLVGVNGTGKTTILKLIMEEINPLKGEIIKSGEIRINYLP